MHPPGHTAEGATRMNQAPLPVSELTLAAIPNAVSWARRHTVDVLQRWRFPDEGWQHETDADVFEAIEESLT